MAKSLNAHLLIWIFRKFVLYLADKSLNRIINAIVKMQIYTNC